MPLYDGTGPFGNGTGGRRRGFCKNSPGGIRTEGAIAGRTGWFLGFFVPVIYAAIRDLSNSTGVIWSIIRYLNVKKKPIGEHKTIRNAEYTVVNNSSKNK